MEDNNYHIKEIKKYLELWGGSPNFDDYFEINPNKLNLFISIYPHYKNLEKKERECDCCEEICSHGKLCLCGKKGIINLRYVQRKSDNKSPLLLVGSCCIKKFLPINTKINARTICVTCREPYKYTKYIECQECREKREMESNKYHIKEVKKYLELWGGSSNFDDYFEIDPNKFNLFVSIYPHYKNLEKKERECDCGEEKCSHGNLCLCGKNDTINLRYIQRKSDNRSPLLLVGSCCLNFFPINTKINARTICVTCREPYKYTKYIECQECREKRERVYFNVPYSEKDKAKYYGCKWDPYIKKWYSNINDINFDKCMTLFSLY